MLILALANEAREPMKVQATHHLFDFGFKPQTP